MKAASRSHATLTVIEADAVEKKIDQALAEPAAADPLQPYREAAAVLLAFDPAQLRPAGEVTGSDPSGGALGLLPELVPAPGARKGGGRWTMPDALRRATLREMGTMARVRAALQANLPLPEESPIDRQLRQIAAGDPLPPLVDMVVEELQALTTVVDWLSGISDAGNLASQIEIADEIERRRDEQTLVRLAGPSFTGRQAERAQIEAHLTAKRSTTLFVVGKGGAGKSALVGEGLLTWTRAAQPPSSRSWLRIDLDDPAITSQDPLTLLDAAVVQLGRRHPAAQRAQQHYQAWRASRRGAYDEANLESNAIDVADTEALGHFRPVLASALTGPEDRLALCIDTFEEAHYFGEEVAERLLAFAVGLARIEWRLRLILCGRTVPDALSGPDAQTDLKKGITVLELKDLPASDATLLLGRLVERAGGTPTPDEIAKAAGAVGGNPLSLMLAAPLLAKDAAGFFKHPDGLRQLRVEAMQAQLYSRVLEHIHQTDVKRLAMPGLIVRLITPAVIADVLAKPCGLGVISQERANALFRDLGKEVALTVRGEDGALHHRTDVRKVMLAAVSSDLADVAREIDRRAVSFWSMRGGAAARGEELYHRLRLGEPTDTLEARWMEEAAPYLRTAFDEWQPGTSAWEWLAGKLGVALGVRERRTVSNRSWVTQIRRAAERRLAAGEPQAALDLLAERDITDHLDLLKLRVQAFLAAGRLDDAAGAARDGRAIAHRLKNSRMAVEMILLESLAHERAEHYLEAMHVLEDAAKLAGAHRDRLLELSVRVRRTRQWRSSSNRLHTRLKAETYGLLLDANLSEVRARPALLRELAAEIGDVHSDLLLAAIDLHHAELTRFIRVDEALEILERVRAINRRDKARLRDADQREVMEHLFKVSDSFIRGDSALSLFVRRRFAAFFRRIVRASRAMGGTGEPHMDPPAPSTLFALSASDRKRLIDVIVGHYTRPMLEQIARYYLSVDLNRLISGGSLPRIAEALVHAAGQTVGVERLLTGLMSRAPDARVRIILRRIMQRGRPGRGG